MTDKILIFGKDTWPYTNQAREAFAKQGQEVKYVNVKADAEKMKAMLKYSDGIRKVPVIVEQGNVTIGFNGGTWGVWTYRLYVDKLRPLQNGPFCPISVSGSNFNPRNT